MPLSPAEKLERKRLDKIERKRRLYHDDLARAREWYLDAQVKAWRAFKKRENAMVFMPTSAIAEYNQSLLQLREDLDAVYESLIGEPSPYTLREREAQGIPSLPGKDV